MSIEGKIRFKAAGLYIVTGIVVVMMLMFFYNIRRDINSQRAEVEKQQHVLALTNKLIYNVSEAQSAASLFVSTYDKSYMDRFSEKLPSINSLIDTLTIIEPSGTEKLQQIKHLLAKRTFNLEELNRQFGNENPLTKISDHFGQYQPPQNNITHEIVNVKQDTVYKPTEKKKGFFSRVKEVFSPEKNSMMVVSKLYVDTVRGGDTSSTHIISEVKSMALEAGERYKKNIQAIQLQVAQQISSDLEISTQLSDLLLYLHRNTLNSVLGTIEQREQAINRNSVISIISGLVALGLILLFILLIIFDVNKGKEARERIKQIMESRHKLLLSVSHDIKSPLGSILGYLELQQQQGENIKSMQNSARHILALLENLLEFSSLEQGSLQLTTGVFSLDDLNEEIGQMFMPLAEAKKLSFKYTTDKVRINSDQMKIKQIIINLVSNAIKYTNSGDIDLQTTYTDNQLHIQVKDTGTGIPADKLEEIFEPFSRIEKNNVLAHGTGLGMYVVKGLVDLLGGSISVTSQTNEGTIVKVTVPCHKSENRINKGSKKIAVYDDVPEVLEMAGNMLKRLGHKIVEQDCDVILTDLEMGELTGLDILASSGNIPVIVMTGHTDFSAEKAAQLGFDGFLAKPFNIEALRQIFGEDNMNESDSFLEEDDEEIRELFKRSSAENLLHLKQALENDDFDNAQAICHKMLTMYVLLGYQADELRRMDAQRGKAYDGWQSDVELILAIKV